MMISCDFKYDINVTIVRSPIDPNSSELRSLACKVTPKLRIGHQLVLSVFSFRDGFQLVPVCGPQHDIWVEAHAAKSLEHGNVATIDAPDALVGNIQHVDYAM